MIHLAKSVVVKLWLLAILLLALTAVTISAGRLAAPTVAGYRGEVEQWASESLGQPVRIGSIELRWKGLEPELVMKDVALLSPESNDPVIRFAEGRVAVALLDSLLSGAVQTSNFTLVGVKVLIKRRSDGSVVAAGLESLDTGRGDAGALFLFPHRISIINSDIFWQNLAIGADPVHFSKVDAQLYNKDNRHQLNLSFDPPGGNGNRTELIADIRGNLERPGGWTGKLYFAGQGLALGELLKYRVPEGYQLRRGTIGMELWSSWKGGRMDWIEGSIGLTDLQLDRIDPGNDQADRSLQIDRLGGYLRWRQRPDDWRLDIQDIVFDRMGLEWPAARFSLATRFDSEGRVHVRSGADFIRIEDIRSVAQMFPLPNPDVDQALSRLRPHSDLYDLRFLYDETGGAPRWSASGEAKSLFTRPWKQIPGVNNLSARFWADQDHGTLRLQSENTILKLPRLFRDPLQLRQLAGQLTWERLEDGGWRIDTPGLNARNDDISTRTRLRLDFPDTPEAPIFMDLQTNFQDGDASTTSRYLPVGVMSPDVVLWLDRSIVGGRVVSGACIVRGPLHSFPFADTHDGRFEVLFDVDDLTFDYWQDWPRLENVAAEMRFLGDRFDIWIDRADLLGNQISQAHGFIRNLRQTSPFELKAHTHSLLDQLLRILDESPLQEEFGPMLSMMKAGGEADLNIALAIPITDDSPFRLGGRLRFLNSSIKLSDMDLTISRIRGDLLFDQNGTRAKEIKGLIFDQPIVVNLLAPPDKPDTIRLIATAPLASSKLHEREQDPFWLNFKGSANWRLQVDIPTLSAPDDTPVQATLSSDLKGMAIGLPSPLQKRSDEARELRITQQFSRNPKRPFTIHYDSILDVTGLLDTQSELPLPFERLAVQLGGSKATMPQTKGIEIGGRLEQLDLGAWMKLSGTQKRGMPLSLPVQKVNLAIDRLLLDGFDLNQLELDLKRRDTGIGGHIASDRFDGEIRIPDQPLLQPIVVDLERLAVEFDPAKSPAKAPAPGNTPPSMDPKQLPLIRLSARKVLVNQHDLGKLELETQRAANGLQLKTFSLIQPEQLEVKASGAWVDHPDGSQGSSVKFSLVSQAFGKLLSVFKYTPNIEGANTRLSGSIHWPGGPLEFAPGKLNGSARVRIEKGRLLEVDPGLGGRVFGLFNVNAVWRRLSLDFSDLFQKGFAFDKIKGDFRIQDGNAYTENFRVRGPAARIEFSGRIGLADEDLDQRVTVIPQVSSALPVAAAVLATPVAGAAVLLAQKLLGKQVDKVTQTQYLVTGPWDNPDFVKISRKDQVNQDGNKGGDTTENGVTQPPLSHPLQRDIFTQGN
jgi:uncharacterized protein (TIGR02099 family)